ncbi:MAG: AMP-binding protein [Euryarchaeota archaeon]|nr:AMP-binding protein [Euryarchaeota archaeon]
MAAWLNLGEILRVNARKFSQKRALKDARRELSFSQYNERSCRLANGLMKLGLGKGDRLCVLSHNCLEFMELYAATAKAGMVAVPINWRISPGDMEYVVDNSDAKAIVVGEKFVGTVNGFRQKLGSARSFIAISDSRHDGYLSYEEVLSSGSADEPAVRVDPQDVWIQLYTSGTTGRPKGVVRTHESYIAFYLLNIVDYGFSLHDYGMIVMPLCHVNSTFYSFVFTYIGGAVYVHREYNFDAAELLEIIDRERVTFTSLIPTHYALILSAPGEARRKFDGSSMKQILCSSAPVRQQMKLDVMKFFRNAALFEAYGSTEAGLVTLLRPEDQLEKLGSIGKECSGTDSIIILDENRRPVRPGEVGELYSRGPMMFKEYYKMPEKTKSSFIGEYFSAGDMARIDGDGYYTLVDRKANMIITGGEHVYPTEVEEVVSKHPAVFDVAVIGVPHDKWGEAVKAVVILKEGQKATEKEIIDFCASSGMASFKRPKSVDFIRPDQMPRTATGKILHRILRERYHK